jgi:hypothetical protein
MSAIATQWRSSVHYYAYPTPRTVKRGYSGKGRLLVLTQLSSCVLWSLETEANKREQASLYQCKHKQVTYSLTAGSGCHFLSDRLSYRRGALYRSSHTCCCTKGRSGSNKQQLWQKHCATNRKVAGSIPDGVAGIFQWLNPSGLIVALGSTQPVTEMSTRNPSWGQRRPVFRADNLTTFMCRLSRNSRASRNPKSLSRPVVGKLLWR